MMSGGCEVDIGGAGPIFKYMYALNLKASFSRVKTDSLDHTKVWSPKLR